MRIPFKNSIKKIRDNTLLWLIKNSRSPIIENTRLIEKSARSSSIDMSTINNRLKTEGVIQFYIGDDLISFDLANRHERCYAATLLLDIKYPQADIDSFLFKKLIKKGDRVLDAGANIGFTALELISLGAEEVLAIEAIPHIFDKLNALSSEKIIKINAAISDRNGEIDMFISQSHNQGSSYNPKLLEIFPDLFGDHPVTVKVQSMSIDGITDKYGRFDVWKIDIEGAEIDLLKGAKSTLNQNAPDIVIAEIFDDFQHEFNELIKESHPHAYRAFIDVSTYQLTLRSITEKHSDQYQLTSPMFVYSKFAIEN